MTAARKLAPIDPYAGPREECVAMIKELEDLSSVTHVELGDRIREAVARIAKAAYQGHLDKLFEQESKDVATWSRPKGSEVRVRERGLETEFGRVTVRRHGLRQEGELAAHFPLDQALNLPAELYTLQLRERVAKEASMASYERTVAHVADVTKGSVPKRQTEQLAIRAAADFEAFYEQCEPAANDALNANALLVLSGTRPAARRATAPGDW